MIIKAKIYSSYALTYSRYYMNVLKKIYGNSLNSNQVDFEIEDISSDNSLSIQSQRSLTKYATRTIRIFENDKLVHIVGITNTNYDLDKQNEYNLGLSKKGKDTYGEKHYHANTYLKQGTAAIFNYYYQQKKINKNITLSFYLLDIQESYPHNLFNILSYRELETIGFKILNLDEVNFSEYQKCCGSLISYKTIQFSSLNKYIRDIAYISNKNSGNTPSFLECNEHEVFGKDGTTTYLVEKYIYTFKSLSAQGYDSLFRCWCLKVLAEKESASIEFKLGKQYFAFKEKDKKISDKLTGPILKTFENANIILNYVSDAAFMEEVKNADNAYLNHKKNKNFRNQSLFRNNLRKKGIPIECILCNEDNSTILDAAHIWEVNKIKDASATEINNFIDTNNLFDLIDQNSAYKNDVFFKKYSLVNSGENGIWLCKNHHGLFDKNYYCFDSNSGKILLHFQSSTDMIDFLISIQNGDNFKLPQTMLTSATKAFIGKRQFYFTV